ncbi:hypothetical protein [Mycobacterium sp. SMC-4]|uniref:hypothetical protein n=1 Tax=Mycobacterium sp. SMC-4 TaxID=2857059 RepID=UPI0021B35DFC|nr:hypothetical protein [Mycobacterium sp. SMC-4]UXA16852.1 hypothetical protein KXD98_19075 [Mycobacterium sp. SMC-4]
MTVYPALTVAVIAVLATATTIAIFLGLANWFGAFFIVRCTECRHLTYSTANESAPSCPHCRHPVLLHPLHALSHPDSRTDVRVTGDRLRY